MGDDDDQTNVTAPQGDEQQPEDYKQSDVEEVFKNAQPSSWQDVVDYLRGQGDQTGHITPGEAKKMMEDFQKLADSGQPFTSDPGEAYRMAHGGNNEGQ